MLSSAARSRIGGFTDELRKRLHGLGELPAQTAGFPHGVSALSDSRPPPGGRESSRSI